MLSGEAWFWREWRHMDILPQGVEDAVERVHVGCSVLSLVIWSVQRAENWEVILVPQAAAATHVGVDNFNEVRHGLCGLTLLVCWQMCVLSCALCAGFLRRVILELVVVLTLSHSLSSELWAWDL